MKNICILFALMIFPAAIAQVAIGKSTVDGSALIDFAQNTQKGLILPHTEDSIQAVAGALTYNSNLKIVQFYNGTEWQNLSVKEGIVDLSEIAALEEVGEGMVIGNSTSTPGVLVLNETGKALVLPKNQAPWENIKNPEPGTITYDPDNDLICIFNGQEWTFWGL